MIFRISWNGSLPPYRPGKPPSSNVENTPVVRTISSVIPLQSSSHLYIHLCNLLLCLRTERLIIYEKKAPPFVKLGEDARLGLGATLNEVGLAVAPKLPSLQRPSIILPLSPTSQSLLQYLRPTSQSRSLTTCRHKVTSRCPPGKKLSITNPVSRVQARHNSLRPRAVDRTLAHSLPPS
jgi:hypothetical protein